MGRAVVILYGKGSRAKAAEWAATFPPGTVVEFKADKRTHPQNARLHAMITRLADQLLYHGQKLDLADWKLVFMDAMNREVRAVPSLDGRGFVNLGRHTHKLTKAECSDLMEIVSAYAAEHGVDLAYDEDREK